MNNTELKAKSSSEVKPGIDLTTSSTFDLPVIICFMCKIDCCGQGYGRCLKCCHTFCMSCYNNHPIATVTRNAADATNNFGEFKLESYMESTCGFPINTNIFTLSYAAYTANAAATDSKLSNAVAESKSSNTVAESKMSAAVTESKLSNAVNVVIGHKISDAVIDFKNSKTKDRISDDCFMCKVENPGDHQSCKHCRYTFCQKCFGEHPVAIVRYSSNFIPLEGIFIRGHCKFPFNQDFEKNVAKLKTEENK